MSQNIIYFHISLNISRSMTYSTQHFEIEFVNLSETILSNVKTLSFRSVLIDSLSLLLAGQRLHSAFSLDCMNL